MDIKQYIRTVNDFPHEGIIFRDITPILQNPGALKAAVNQMAEVIEPLDFDYIIGPESRGFIFGVPVAFKMDKGFIPVRKSGKLPYTVVKKEYALEYGNAVIEMHSDAIKPGQKVVIVDDLLATGGTSKALVELIEELGGVVQAIVFLIELEDLKGRELLEGYNVTSLLKY